MSSTHFMEITSEQNLLDIQHDLEKMVDSGLDPNNDKVTIQFTLDFPLVVGIIGWVVCFWFFGKSFFFPTGKFRKPKLHEVIRNFKGIMQIMKLKNMMIGLWKDRKAASQMIGDHLKKALSR